jgi:hypothetical protein
MQITYNLKGSYLPLSVINTRAVLNRAGLSLLYTSPLRVGEVVVYELTEAVVAESSAVDTPKVC